jgi:site-specific DNA recombinase
MQKAVVYARVSSKEQEREGFSIPAQLKLLNEYAEQHGFKVVEEFTDSETAKKAGRTNFLAMIDKVKKSKDVRVILVEKTDRLTRNFQDYVLIDELIQKLDIEVHMTKEGEILSQKAKSHTKLIHGIKVVLAKNFIDNLSEETAKGMLEKAAQGHWPSTAPYGYRNNKETRLVELDPEKAPYVKRAFELYATGIYSIKRLINKLQEEGYRFRPSSPKASTSNIHHILTNKFYTGHFVFRDLHRVGHHPPIVAMELFNLVQRQLKASNKPDYEKRDIAFANLITCGHCGCNVIGDIKQKGRYIYYRCTHYKQKCPDKYIREEKLQEQFAEMVRAFTPTEGQYQWMMDGLKRANALKDQEVAERREHLNAEISRINNRLSQLYEDKLDGVIDSVFYQKKAKAGRERLTDLQTQLERVQAAGENQMALGLTILEFAKDAYPLFSRMVPYEQAKMLRIVLSKCCLKDGELTATYKKPFDVLVEGAKSKHNYPQGNSNPTRCNTSQQLIILYG